MENNKNLWVLPTDKPSRLYIGDNQNFVFGMIQTLIQSRNDDFTNQNIYITSENKDINENDYIITQDGRLVQVSYLLSKDLEQASKIVLTTDQDLIKDNVQAIDDEFLEWFIKNPSCEWVEVDEEDYSQRCKECGETVKRGYNCSKGCFMKSGNFIPTDKNIKYKIIIPKQEPNPFELPKTLPDDVFYESLEPKQETLEEALNNYITDKHSQEECIGFIDGYELAQKRSYSEEDLRKAFFSGCQSERQIKPRIKCWEEWFEQFKKK